MKENDNTDRDPSTKVFVYRGNVPLWLGLIIAAPLLLLAFSLAAALAVGGLFAALVLPLVFRRRVARSPGDNSIELEASEYHHVAEPNRRLPHDKA